MHDQSDNETQGVDDQMAFPSIDLLASIVSPKPPFSVVFTDWLSMMAALGVGCRPQAFRTCSRRRSWILFQTPAATKDRK